MAAPFLVIGDAFSVGRLGVVIAPGPLESSYEGPREMMVRLRTPSGDEQVAPLKLEAVLGLKPVPLKRRWACRLPSAKLSDVPIGTEVWLVEG
jgi:hypothetical protein